MLFVLFIAAELVFPAQMLPAGPQVWFLWPQQIMPATHAARLVLHFTGSLSADLRQVPKWRARSHQT